MFLTYIEIFFRVLENDFFPLLFVNEKKDVDAISSSIFLLFLANDDDKISNTKRQCTQQAFMQKAPEKKKYQLIRWIVRKAKSSLPS